jgi:hypothetical protein
MKIFWIIPLGAALAAFSLAAVAADPQPSAEDAQQQAQTVDRLILEQCDTKDAQAKKDCVAEAEKDYEQAAPGQQGSQGIQGSDLARSQPPENLAETQPAAPEASASNMREASATGPAR